MRHIPFISYRKQGRNYYLSGQDEVNRFLRNLPFPCKIIAIG
jgi:hypothetical protein